MKFVSLRTKHTDRRIKLDKPPGAGLESFATPIAAPHQIHTYTELRQQIHHDLRLQHPEWVHPDGESPMCDSYEARLMELLEPLMGRGSNESVAAAGRVLDNSSKKMRGISHFMRSPAGR